MGVGLKQLVQILKFEAKNKQKKLNEETASHSPELPCPLSPRYAEHTPLQTIAFSASRFQGCDTVLFWRPC
jgi:hypothetical protein